MVKVASNDALSILRKFDIAGDEHVPRHIERLVVTHPNDVNTLAQFRFLSREYYILFDDTAEDDIDYIESQIQGSDSLHGSVLANPNDHIMTYGLPYHGKDVYVYATAPTGVRLDIELARRYPDTSRSTWQKHIKAGHVSVAGAVVTSPKTQVDESIAIDIAIPERDSQFDTPLDIIYLDDHVIVIDKPIGILSHAKGALLDEFTVADFFRPYTTYHLDTNRPGIIHRLDRDTSGVMIGARDAETAALLQKQFSNRTVKKSYTAVVTGQIDQPELMIDLPIGRNPSAPSTFRVDANGKSAETRLTVERVGEENTRVLLRPKTGRTHQLRVHMSYLNHPIVGDRVYGTPADRLYLHATSLEVTLPGGERRVFHSNVPASFNEILV